MTATPLFFHKNGDERLDRSNVIPFHCFRLSQQALAEAEQQAGKTFLPLDVTAAIAPEVSDNVARRMWMLGVD